MINVEDKEFEALVAKAIDDLPDEYINNMKNVAIVVEDWPSEQQKQKLELCEGQTLYGLYEGIPLTKRGGNYSFVLPDKITIFKEPIKHNSFSDDELKTAIRTTVWHEVAHHFGLDHKQIHKIENKLKIKG